MFSGSYVLAGPADAVLAADTAQLLTERFLSLVARTEAISAFSERPTNDLPRGWFERLGTLLLDEGGSAGSSVLTEQPAFFR